MLATLYRTSPSPADTGDHKWRRVVSVSERVKRASPVSKILYRYDRETYNDRAIQHALLMDTVYCNNVGVITAVDGTVYAITTGVINGHSRLPRSSTARQAP
jgi:hypothetical protein